MVCGPLGSSVRALTQAAQLGEGGDGLALREDGDEHGDGGEQARDCERDRARRRVHDSPKAAGNSAVLARMGENNGTIERERDVTNAVPPHLRRDVFNGTIAQ